MNSKDVIYIYNIFQANYLIQNGCEVIETGYGKKKDVYWKFIRNQKTDNTLTRWRERKLG